MFVPIVKTPDFIQLNIKNKKMTELQLYKFVTENKIEYHWIPSDNDVIMFVDVSDIEEFNKLLPSHLMEEEGLDCVMKEGYFCFKMFSICQRCDIVLENIFSDKSN